MISSIKTENQIIESWESKEIKITFCCTSFNDEDYIEKSLNGFLSQRTKFGFQILIHDDASNDGTQEIINNYKKEYPNLIKTIIQEDNVYSQGFLPFLHFLSKEVDSEYIAFCNADDYWTSQNKIQKQVEILEKNLDANLIHHNCLKITEDNFKISEYHNNPVGKLSFEKILKSNKINASTTVFRNICFKNLRDKMFNTKFADRILWLYLTKEKDCLYINDVMSNYRVHRNGLYSGMSYIDKLKSRIASFKNGIRVNFDQEKNKLVVNFLCSLYVEIFFVLLLKIRFKEALYFFEEFKDFYIKNNFRFPSLLNITLNIIFFKMPLNIYKKLISNN